jgi:hypothetical protein
MKKNEVWKNLEMEKIRDKDNLFYGKGASEEEIKKAENTLKTFFNEQYKKFLRLYDSATMEGHEIYGVNPMPGEENSFISNVIQNTHFYKNEQKWPSIEDWVIISDDGSGNPIGIKPNGEVWLSDHDAGFEQVKLADDFEDFLYKLLTDTLYEE